MLNWIYTMNEPYDVIIIGAGLAGLRAAHELEKFELKALVIDQSDRAGGRVKTDEIDGFLLDRGFQVYLDAYPEGREVLDYDQLSLKPFQPGALCFNKHQKFRVSDTSRKKTALPRMALSPIGNFMDKIRLGNLSARLKRSGIEEIFERPNLSSYEVPESNCALVIKIIQRFFQPFFAGIFLEQDLKTSSRMFEFIFKMMAEGNVSLPAFGMEQIPRSMKNALRTTEFRFHTEVKEIRQNEVVLEGQENLSCKHIIVATAPDQLIPQLASDVDWHQSATYYFAADKSVLNKNLIALNYAKKRLVNNFTILTDTSEHYAPKGEHLVSVSLSQLPHESVEETSRLIKNELSYSFGPSVQNWRFIKNYHLSHALPVLSNLKNQLSISETQVKEGLYLAGDQLLNGSINGALKSGKLAAQEAILQYRSE
ncbi:MAG: FAD-dependent oxidoreductase [Owenweeksia sp.]|nr:FAD-dependent oxidoreductase [Owenweeksia sp.]